MAAQYFMSAMTEESWGRAADPVEVYVWHTPAMGKAGQIKARNLKYNPVARRDKLGRKMTRLQIAEAEKMIKGAQAYRVERIRRSQGDADRFNLIYSEYKNAPDITEKRLYLETMEKILPRMQKYIVETDGSGGLLNILNLDKKDGAQ